MAKEKTNQEGGAILAKDPKAAAMELKKNQKGAAKGMDHKKGAADYSVGKGSHDHPHGASRMGYNQSFGAARVSGYSKGAAKVADIMSFGASKYMKHGAADAGHGGVAGHDHPSMTTKSRSVSGGGSNSSSSSTSGGSGGGTSYASAYNNANKDKYPTLASFTDAAKAYNANKSSSSSTSSGGGSSTTSSKTIVSPNSMAETKLGGEIKAENRSQRNAFNKAETNISAGNDSITASNQYLDKLPAFNQNSPKAQKVAGIVGGRAAKKRRVSSKDFSPTEALQIYKAGQSK